MTFSVLLWQACETIFLLKQLWPEGSDIRRVLCVTSCSLSLRMYHHFLENRKKSVSDENINIQEVWLYNFTVKHHCSPLLKFYWFLSAFSSIWYFIYFPIYSYKFSPQRRNTWNLFIGSIYYIVVWSSCFTIQMFPFSAHLNDICPIIQKKENKKGN